jgi:hypothetical protein
MFISSVKAQEASGSKGPLGLFGKSYALAITVIIDDAHSLADEMRVINEHYINWLKRRGKSCQDLILGFTAPPNSENAILDQCRRLLMQSVGDEKTLAAMNVEVVIVNAENEESREFKLKWDPNAKPGIETPKQTSTEPSAVPGEEVWVFKKDDPRLAQAIAEAQRRIPEFKALLECCQSGITVCVPFANGDVGEVYEGSLVERKGDELEVEFTPKYAPGPIRKTFHFKEILDWTVYHENGETTGGFTASILGRPT